MNRTLKNYCGGSSAALHGARILAYLKDMSRLLRSVRLASDRPRYVFQHPVNSTRLLLLALTVSLTACGFHLRGSQLQDMAFAFKSLYIKTPGETPFVADLRTALNSNKVAMTSSADAAELVLEVVSEQTNKNILSLSGSGRVQEFQLIYRVSLRAYDNKQIDWLPPEEIMLTRILAYDDAQILAKEQEEAQLYRDMRADAVGQAIRRLNRAKPQL